MYQKYSTDALVLRSREQGEADKVFALYTADFGLVWARASSVRAESSKMRAALQSCSRAQVSLVKGKRGWRLAGAVADVSAVSRNPASVAAFARAAELILRLVAGEERNQYLFDSLAEAQEALYRDTTDAASVEIVCVARILFALGYLSAEALETTLFAHTSYGLPHLEEAGQKKDALIAFINRAISETQL